MKDKDRWGAFPDLPRRKGTRTIYLWSRAIRKYDNNQYYPELKVFFLVKDDIEYPDLSKVLKIFNELDW